MPAPLDPECIFAELANHDVEFVLIGGLAAVLHGSTAMTNDVDIVPDAGGANLARLGEALVALDARIRSTDTAEGVAFDPHPALLASMAVLNLTTRCGDLDLALTPSGIDDLDGLRDRSVVYEIAGRRVHVAALEDIIRSKEAAGRTKDHATLPILRALLEEIRRS